MSSTRADRGICGWPLVHEPATWRTGYVAAADPRWARGHGPVWRGQRVYLYRLEVPGSAPAAELVRPIQASRRFSRDPPCCPSAHRGRDHLRGLHRMGREVGHSQYRL